MVGRRARRWRVRHLELPSASEPVSSLPGWSMRHRTPADDFEMSLTCWRRRVANKSSVRSPQRDSDSVVCLSGRDCQSTTLGPDHPQCAFDNALTNTACVSTLVAVRDNDSRVRRSVQIYIGLGRCVPFFEAIIRYLGRLLLTYSHSWSGLSSSQKRMI